MTNPYVLSNAGPLENKSKQEATNPNVTEHTNESFSLERIELDKSLAKFST